MKRPQAQTHENHERWLVSYADFITLLFAFFVVMFASSQGNKAAQVSAAVRAAMEEDKFTSAVTTALGRGKHEANKKAVKVDPNVTQETLPPAQAKSPPTPNADPNVTPAAPPAQPRSPPAPKADLQKSLQQLQVILAAELQSGKVQVRLDERGLTISLREAAFFDSGEATILPSSLPTIDKIASVVSGVSNPVRLEGHTDARPIHNSRYRNNWELSAGRAISMLELLEGHFHVESERMSVAGYAENAPSDTNETEEGRAHNRRVDLVVLSEEGMKSQPPPGPKK